MIDKVTIGEKDVVLSNAANWAIIYRDQFGHDIIPTVMPLLAGILDILGGIAGNITKDEEGNAQLTIEDAVKALDSGGVYDALIHLSGFELVELFNITWAMNKAAVDSVEDPRTWISKFDVFPVDEVAPKIFGMMATGLMSSKNLKRLKSLMETIQPSISIPSSQPPQNEDSASET